MQQKIRSFSFNLSYLSRSYRMMLGSLTMMSVIVVIWRSYITFPVIVPLANCTSGLLEQHKKLLALIPGSYVSFLNQQSLKIKLSPPRNNTLNKYIDRSSPHHLNEYIVSTGDTLSTILIQYGINIADVMTLAQQYPILRHLKVGQPLSWALTSAGNLQRLIWKISHREVRTYDRISRGFKENISNMVEEWHHIMFRGRLSGSFISSAHSAGLTISDINTVTNALKWQIDFKKLHKGDQFSVLASRDIRDNRKVKNRLLGIRLHTGGKDFYAFRAENGKFYNQNAANLAHSFILFPIPIMQKFRISSKFNLNRLHPITGRIIPHRGVDFAVPIGTPVLAVGDGEVVVRKKNDIAGNYVVIRHSHQYMTRYMHLKKLFVKPGQQVKRGERIALSGNSGRSTGPHLHFEVWINQKAVNPLTIKLSNAEELTGIDRMKYLEQVKKILPQLQFH